MCGFYYFKCVQWPRMWSLGGCGVGTGEEWCPAAGWSGPHMLLRPGADGAVESSSVLIAFLPLGPSAADRWCQCLHV